MRWFSKVMIVYFVHPFQGICGTFKRMLRIIMMGWYSLIFFVDKYRFGHASC